MYCSRAVCLTDFVVFRLKEKTKKWHMKNTCHMFVATPEFNFTNVDMKEIKPLSN